MNLKRFVILSIKYGPTVMALTASIKILLIASYGEDKGIEPVYWINILLNLLITVVLYYTGKYFHFCWKHQSLCRTAWNGYIGYGLFLIFDIPLNVIYPICVFYVVFVIIVSILYKGV